MGWDLREWDVMKEQVLGWGITNTKDILKIHKKTHYLKTRGLNEVTFYGG